MPAVSPMQNCEMTRPVREVHWPVICVALVAMLAVAASSFARADDDLPGRVGRIADFGGQLYLSAQDRPDDWTSIGINYPVASGDNLWVSSDGRAEVDYGGGQLRLAGDTSVNIAGLDDRQLVLFVARGRLIVRVRVLDSEDVARIDTPNTQIELTRPGLYRIEVTLDGSTTKLGVREGEGLVAVAAGAQQVLPGQLLTVSGTEPLAADIRGAFGADGLDTWSADRDRYYERARAAPYVSRQMVGFAELDQYGSWEESPVYGPVWYPTAVAPDWAPYEDGYWANVGTWGLTWVDFAPWGYAPSHYGRWVRNKGRWGWCPGGYVARPQWAPALVAWYGGSGWGITANGGAPVYAWAPLGWGEAYAPGWRACSPGCWNRYNKPYGVDPADRSHPRTRHSNVDVPGAMVAAPGATLVGRKPVRTTRVAVPASQLASVPLLATPPSVTPRSFSGQVFRPGERGTPTPASAVSSTTRRTVHLPTLPRTASAEPAAAGSTGAPAASAAPSAQSPSRVRAGPILLAPPQTAGETQAPAGRGATTADAARDAQATQTTRRPAPALPPGYLVGTPREPSGRYGTAVAPAAAPPQPSGPPYATRGSFASSPVGATGIALPPPSLALPPAGIALPPPSVTMPPTGIVLPPASAMFPPTRPAAAPLQAQPGGVVVPVGVSAVAPQGDPGAVRGGSDADGPRGTRAGAAPAPPASGR